MVMVVGAVSAVDIGDIMGDFSDHRITCGRAEMTTELKHALETIKNTCRKQKNCDDCPLNDPNGDACYTWRKEPWQWKPDEWEMEGKNGRG